ncbi:MAG TPA: hypothetical protein VLB69_10030, partial [Rudaea sp.]|nr:hypothetical protein [Rudaea sp.]
MTNWALDDDYAFQYQCDAYVLNVNLAGTQRFRISDAASSPATTFGGAPRTGAAPVARQVLPLHRVSDAGGAGDLTYTFNGEHTIMLRFDQSPGMASGNPTITIGPKDFSDPAVA